MFRVLVTKILRGKPVFASPKNFGDSNSRGVKATHVEKTVLYKKCQSLPQIGGNY